MRVLEEFTTNIGDLSPKNGLEHRLLNLEDAKRAKAMYGVNQKLEDVYYGEVDPTLGRRAVQYIEAQILGGVSMDDVKEIIINADEIDFGMDGLKEKYPKYAHLFRFAK
jgi:hypothetical protein